MELKENSALVKIFYSLAAVGAFIGGFEFFSAMTKAQSAPQQAAGAAMALCWAVLPYVLARAVQEANR